MWRDDIAMAICALLAFLIPVGFYCLILASVNRRSKPMMVSGVWDSVGLLFAVSGFFLATVPMLVSKFYTRVFDFDNHFFSLWLQHWLLLFVYFTLLVSASVFMIIWRSRKTMIYNVDLELFPKALERAFANAGVYISMRKHQRLILTPASPSENPINTAITQTAPPSSLAPPPPGNRGWGEGAVAEDFHYAEVEIETFPSMRHITLHWVYCPPAIRRRLETVLTTSLESAAPLVNPAAGWFLNISGLIFGTLLMVVLTFVILIMTAQRGK
jgi:hypothetical protein